MIIGLVNSTDQSGDAGNQLLSFADAILPSESPLLQSIRDVINSFPIPAANSGVLLILTIQVLNQKSATIEVRDSMTLALFRLLSESSLGKLKTPITTMLINRSGLVLDRFDDKTLFDCGIKNLDTITLDFQPRVMRGVRRAYASGLTPHSNFQMIVLALHAFMLDEQFETVVELYDMIGAFVPTCKGEYKQYSCELYQ